MQVTFPKVTPDTPIGSSAGTADTFGRMNSLLDDDAPEAEETDGDEGEPEGDDPDDEPEAEEVAETPAAESVDPLIEEAEHYGFSKEDAMALGDKLPAVFAQLDRQAAALVRKQMGESEPEVPAKPAAKVEPEQPASELFKPLESIKLELDPADYDEPMLKQLGAFEKTINSAIERINKQQEGLSMVAEAVLETHGGLTKFTSETQSQSEAKFADEMDSFFAGQAELKATFGTVPMAQLTPGSAEVTARQKLVEEMKILEAGDKHFGRPVRTPQQYATRALRVLHGEKVIAAARKDVAGDLAAQRKKSIARPSGRNKQLTNVQRATAGVAEWLAAKGLN